MIVVLAIGLAVSELRDGRAPLFNGLGSYYPVTTDSPKARRYFQPAL